VSQRDLPEVAPTSESSGTAAVARPLFAESAGGSNPLKRTYRTATRFARRQPVGAVAAVMLLIFSAIAVLGSSVTPYDPAESISGARLQSPSADHPLGTDDRARDVLSRTMAGARISLEVAFLAVGLGVITGTILGVTTGYFGGIFDLAVQRLMDSLAAFPGLVLALTFAALLGAGIINVMIAIGIIIIPGANRIVRGQTLSVAQNQYVDAARTLGASELRVITRS
jgi:peptide/nickel transport system permease protein